MLLEISDLTYSYGKNLLFSNFDLIVSNLDRVAILAPSGTGKTTLCKIIAGYISPITGKIFINNRALSSYNGYCPIQMLWQNPEEILNPKLKMKQILKEIGEIDFSLLKSLNIDLNLLERYPRELSGGELQRFCIARILNTKTKFIIADEITTMFDLISQSYLWNFILKFCKKNGIGLIFTSHSDELVEKIATKKIYLKDFK